MAKQDKEAPGRPFKKGQSGNPGGRPKLPPEVREAAKALTQDAIDTLASVMRDTQAAPAARVSAATSILDRGWGKPSQAIDLGGQVTVKTLADFYGQADT